MRSRLLVSFALVTGSICSLLSASCSDDASSSEVSQLVTDGGIKDGAASKVEMVKNLHSIEGYPSAMSVKPGDTVQLMVHSPEPPFSIEFVRYGAEEKVIAKVDSIEGGPQDFPRDAAQMGARWKPSYAFKVPSTWTSGLYAARLQDKGGEFHAGFIVRDPDTVGDAGAEPTAPIAIVASTLTWAAYNNWGGDDGMKTFEVWPASFYGKKSDFSHIARPNVAADPSGAQGGHLGNAFKYLPRWFESQKIPYTIIADQDLHNDASILSKFKAVVLDQHSEYWSAKMYDGLEAYLKGGGNILHMGSNSIYWKITVKDGQVECRKVKERQKHTHDNTQGGYWNEQLGRPGSALLGVEYTDVAHASTYTCAPYKILQADHWVFEGTGYKNDDLVGATGLNKAPGTAESCLKTGAASGFEMDQIQPTSPKNIVLLAKGQNPNVVKPQEKGLGAEMTIYEYPGGGSVFGVGSITFTGAMLEDKNLSRVISNVVTRFTQ